MISNFKTLKSFKLYSIVLLGYIFIVPSVNLKSQIQNSNCLGCHGKTDFMSKMADGTVKQLFVSDSSLRSSPHKGFYCIDCHSDVTELDTKGHKNAVKKVQCIQCHSDNNSTSDPENKKIIEFKESVHSTERLKGNKNTPICQNCHGSHDIRSKSSLTGLELKKKITQMCKNCHFEVFAVYRASIHGRALFEKNIMEVPVCSDCHGEHTIKKTDDSVSAVYKTNIQNTCGNCHDNERIVGKYNISPEKYQTFEKSAHGIAGKLGESRIANCASCHGAHDIKPQNDPTSSINPNNLVRTCGKCHQDANINYIKGKIHINVNSKESGVIYYENTIFKWITIFALVLFIFHIIFDQYKRVKFKKTE